MRKVHLLLFFFSVLSLKVHSQQKVIDSINVELENYELKKKELGKNFIPAMDTVLLRLINTQSYAYIFVDIDKSKQYALQAVALASSLTVPGEITVNDNKGWAKGLSRAYSNLGNTYNILEKLDSSEYYHLQALKLAEKAKDDQGIARVYANLPGVYRKKRDYNKAIEYWIKAFEYYRKTGSDNYAGAMLTNIAQTNLNIKSYDAALKYYNEALDILRPTKYYDYLTAAYVGRSLVYSKLNQTENELADLDSAKSLADITGNIKQEYAILMNKGQALEKKGSLEASIHAFRSAKELALEMNSNKDICFSLTYVASPLYSFFIKTKQPQYLSTLKNVVDSIRLYWNPSNNQELSRSYFLYRSRLDSINGDLNNAYRNYYLFVQVNDSIKNKERRDEVNELSVKAEFERKSVALKIENEKKDLILKGKIERQQLFMYLIVAGLLIAGFFSFVLFKRNKEKIRRQQELETVNLKLTQTISEVKKSQEELIKTEKMAAYGTVASRMAHEILNPLNFINNFSLLSKELLVEIKDSVDVKEKQDLAYEMNHNVEKVLQHSKRAEDILKSLDEHINSGKAHEFFT